MQNKFFLIGALIGLSVFVPMGCQNSLTKEEYIQWMKDEQNGLLKKKEIGDYIFELQYKSPELMLISDKSNNGSGIKIENRNQMQYFDLKIKRKDGQDFIKTGSVNESDFYNRQYYFSFAFQNDIKIQEKEATYNCDLFHFERSYGLTASRTFVLGFEQPAEEKQDDKTLIIDAQKLGVGIVRIKFNKEDIDNIPKVVL